jgi:hypothetical protein
MGVRSQNGRIRMGGRAEYGPQTTGVNVGGVGANDPNGQSVA